MQKLLNGGYIAVSIPRSEFWLFGHTNDWAYLVDPAGFNSPLGILVVRTYGASW